MGDSPTPPAVQNAGQVAGTQQQLNTQTAQQQQQYNQQVGTQNLIGSAANQITPYGSLSYSFGTGPNGQLQLTANQQLSPAQQAQLDALQRTQLTAGNNATDLLSSGNYGQAPDLSSDAGSIVSQNLQNYTNYLSPFFTQQTNQLDNQLRNQGLVPGTQAYDNAINNLRQSQGQQVSGYIAQMQPEAYNQAVQSYELPLQTASNLAALGAPSGYGSQNANTPMANYQAPQVGTVNYGNIAANQGQLANQQYQQQLQQNSGLLSGLFGVGGSLLGGPIGGALGSSIGGLFGGSSGSTLSGWDPTVFYGS